MTIQIQDIDRKVLKAVMLEIFQERKDLLKEIVKEILIENESTVVPTKSALSDKRKSLILEIMEKNKEVLQKLAQ